MKSTREQVEEWLKAAPKGINIVRPMFMEQDNHTVEEMGKHTVKIIHGSYRGTIEFTCKSWD